MEVNAKLRYLRMSPRKVRLVADLVRGKKVQPSLDQLTFARKAAAKPLAKLIESAIANAVNNFGLSKDNLLIKEVMVDKGPALKRSMPRAQGRASLILKHTSHVNLILSEIVDSGVHEGKKVKIVEPVKLSAKPAKNDLGTDGVKVSDGDEQVKSNRPQSEGGSASKGFAQKVFQRKSG